MGKDKCPYIIEEDGVLMLKKVLIGVGVILVIILLVGNYYFYANIFK